MDQQNQNVITMKGQGEFNFELESPQNIIQTNEIEQYQNRKFLKNYDEDEKWGMRNGVQGVVTKYNLKKGLKPNAQMPSHIARKQMWIKDEDHKLEAQREIQAFLNISSIADSPQQCLNFYGWKKDNIANYSLYMEFCEEGSFADYMETRKKQNKPFTNDEIFNYFEQLIKVLTFMKSFNLAHRDLKPDNILYKNGILKIADFGKSKIGHNQNMLKENKTLTNQYVGSMPYAAPEISYFIQRDPLAKNCEYDIFAADMYSVGLIISSLLKNDPIFRQVAALNGKNIDELREQEATNQLPPELKISGPFDQYLESIINQEMTKRVQSPKLNFIRGALSQMLIYNPYRRTTLLELKRQLILSKLSSTDFDLLEYQIMINNQPEIFSKVAKDIQTFKSKIAKLDADNKSLLQQTNQLQIQLQNSLQKQQYQQVQQPELVQSPSKSQSPVKIQKPMVKKSRQEVIQNCLQNDKDWNIWDMDGDRIKKVEEITKLKYNSEQWTYPSSKDVSDWYDLRDSRPQWWKEQDLSQNTTYWRDYWGYPKFIESDLPKAFQLVKKLEKESGYEFEDCHRIMHSNFYDFNKSLSDLLN